MDQLEPATAAYNMALAWTITGPLQVSSAERALTEIVRRHEALRTTSRVEGEMPVQVIAAPGPMNLSVVDLSSLPEAQRPTEVERAATEEARRAFSLAHGPLLRVTLFAAAPDEHVLLVTTHHIVSDGWSMGLFVTELTSLYEAFSRGAPPPLPELTLQYADFALWQRDSLRGQVLRHQLDYWKR